MNLLDVRNALVQAVIDNATVQIAYENSGFDPVGLDAFISTHFMPATSEAMGKLQDSNDDERGVFQISVFVKSNADDYDNQQWAIILGFKSIFFNSAVIGDVDILEVTTNGGYAVESWYKRDISVNYMSFTDRS